MKLGINARSREPHGFSRIIMRATMRNEKQMARVVNKASSLQIKDDIRAMWALRWIRRDGRFSGKKKVKHDKRLFSN